MNAGRVIAAVRAHKVMSASVTVAVLVIGVVAVAASSGGDGGVQLASDDTTTSSSTTTTEPTTTTRKSTTTTQPSTTTSAPVLTTAAPTPTTAAPPPIHAVSLYGDGGIFELDHEGTNPRRLVTGLWRAADLSPDGRWFAGLLVRDNVDRLAIVNRDGSGLRVLDGGWSAPRISPDGTKIVATLYREGSSPQLRIMNRDGSGQRPLPFDDPYFGNANQADWSPDGRHLVITRYDGSSLSVYDLATGKVRYLGSQGTAGGPRWSPDGSMIAFERNGSIMLIRPGGGTARVVTQGSFPAWETATSLLLYDGGRILRVNTDGSGLRQLAAEYSAPV